MSLSKNKNKKSSDYMSESENLDEEIELDIEGPVADDEDSIDNEDVDIDQDEENSSEGSRMSSFDTSNDVQIELDTKVEHDGKLYRGVQKVPSNLAETLLELDKTNMEERNI